MAVELIYLAIAALLAPALAEMAKIRAKAGKAFTWIAVGGVLFVLAATSSLVSLDAYIAGLSGTITTVASVLGFVTVLVGAVMASVALLKE